MFLLAKYFDYVKMMGFFGNAVSSSANCQEKDNKQHPLYKCSLLWAVIYLVLMMLLTAFVPVFGKQLTRQKGMNTV